MQHIWVLAYGLQIGSPDRTRTRAGPWKLCRQFDCELFVANRNSSAKSKTPTWALGWPRMAVRWPLTGTKFQMSASLMPNRSAD